MSEIKVKRKIIGGIQYLIDNNNNVYDEDSRELIGVYDPETKTITPDEEEEDEEEEQIEIRVIKVKEDMFPNKDEWEYIRPFDFRIDIELDEDNEYAIYNTNGDIVSYSTNRDEFEDITDIGMPFKAPLEHSYEVVEVFINTLVGYNGSQTEGSSIFEFPIYWNGTIDVGNNTEKINTNVNLEEKVGDLQVQMEEDDDIDDYSNSQLASIVLRAVNTEDYAQVKLIKKVVTDIENDFLKPMNETIQKGKVSIPVKKPLVVPVERLKIIPVDEKGWKFERLYNLTRIKYYKLKNKERVTPSELKELKNNLDELNRLKPSNDEQVKDLAIGFNALLRRSKSQVRPPAAVAVDVPTAIATKVNDELENKLSEYKSLSEIFNNKKKQYDRNKTLELKLEVLQIKDELQKILSEMKELKEGKQGTGISNPELYEKAKQIADEKYKKPSAYKSGFIVKTYKELGGTYSGEKPKTTGIARWFKEDWKDIGNKEYPVYRPTKRVTKDTPLTPDEIKPSNLKKQIALKQEIKGKKNLPPFLPFGKVEPNERMKRVEVSDKETEILNYSNPKKVLENAINYFDKNVKISISDKKDKKYMVYNPTTNKWVHFGQMGYEDFTKHQDKDRRKNYLTRTANMRGNWKNDKYSANNLSRNLLW